MKEGEPKYKTQILRYSVKKGGWSTYGDCDLLQNLRFANREFYLVYKKGCYFMCTDKGKSIASVYYKKEIEDGDKILPGEVVSLFRKNYLKNGITPEMVELFLEDPVSYQEKYRKNKPAQQ